MSPELLKMLMPFLAGAGLHNVTTSLEKIMKAMGAAPQGAKPGQPSPGMPAGATPPGAAAPPQGQQQIDPQMLQMLAMMQARG